MGPRKGVKSGAWVAEEQGRTRISSYQAQGCRMETWALDHVGLRHPKTPICHGPAGLGSDRPQPRIPHVCICSVPLILCLGSLHRLAASRDRTTPRGGALGGRAHHGT
jgi:hypothetical protein